MGWAEGQDRGLVTVAERAAELARRAKAHMTAAGRPWRDDRDGYVCGMIALGRQARLPKASPKNDETLKKELKDGVEWGEDQTIDAELVRWLCADPDARPLIPHTGVHIFGARIIGTLELAFAEMTFPLGLVGCNITTPVVFIQTRLAGLALTGSRCRDIHADGIDVQGDVLLRDGFHATGEVRLLGGTIGGNVDCSGGRFEHPRAKDQAGAYALNADGIDVKGSVFLRGGFHATGEVRLLGATIGGALDCSGGTFENPRAKDDVRAYALIADRIDVQGGVFLSGGFHANGEVRLLGATIGGDLVCAGGRFEHPRAEEEAEAHALSADGIDVKGGVFLSGGFHATGEVRLLGATIGGDLVCAGGRFEHPRAEEEAEAHALNADHIDVKGGVLLRDGAVFRGYVRLMHARVGATLQLRGGDLLADSTLDLRAAYVGRIDDQTAAWPGAGKLLVEGLRYDAIDGDAPNSAGERLEWLKRTPSDRFHTQPYTQLASVLRASGDRAGANRVLIEREWQALRHDPRWWAKALGWLRGHGLAFGFEPERALYGIVALWLLGSALFFWGYRCGVIVPTQADALVASGSPSGQAAPAAATASLGAAADGVFWVVGPPADAHVTPAVPAPAPADTTPTLRPGYPRFWAMIYSFDTLAPIIDLHQDNYYRPRSDTGWGAALLGYLVWFHIPMGWLLFTLFLAAVTGLVTPGDG